MDETKDTSKHGLSFSDPRKYGPIEARKININDKRCYSELRHALRSSSTFFNLHPERHFDASEGVYILSYDPEDRKKIMAAILTAAPNASKTPWRD